MKIAFISPYLPTADNLRGPTSLPFVLLKYRPENSKLRIYSFAQNVLKEELADKLEGISCLNPEKITVCKPSGYFFPLIKGLSAWMIPAIFRYRLDSDTVAEILDFEPDVVFLYPSYGFLNGRHFTNSLRIIGWPDCITLKLSRMLECGEYSSLKIFFLNLITYFFAIRTERSISKEGNVLYLVGERDKERFIALGGKPDLVFYAIHPHNPVSDSFKKDVFTGWRIKIFVSWGNEAFLKKNQLDRIIDSIAEKNFENISFTFLWKSEERYHKRLLELGFDSRLVNWVEDYHEFLLEHDILVSPYDSGTGTKGKILQAMAAGLLCIGNGFAFENICGSSGKEYVMYDSPEEIGSILEDVLNRPEKYLPIAHNGRMSVKNAHNPTRACGLFWNEISNRLF